MHKIVKLIQKKENSKFCEIRVFPYIVYRTSADGLFITSFGSLSNLILSGNFTQIMTVYYTLYSLESDKKI